jgi:hypothetical protein
MKIVNAITDALNMAASLHPSDMSGPWYRQFKLPGFNPQLTSPSIRGGSAKLSQKYQAKNHHNPA